jgi:hypothetical protein
MTNELLGLLLIYALVMGGLAAAAVIVAAGFWAFGRWMTAHMRRHEWLSRREEAHR